jgi:hypothetical protein
MPRTVAILVLVLAAVALACPGQRRPPDDGVDGERFGVYRGRFIDPEASPRKFKVLLFAALPDRLHAEVLPPVGGPALIIDGGSGRLAVTIQSREAAWVGEAREGVLEAILGFPVSLEDLVSALIQGSALSGPVEFSRNPKTGAGLPRSFELGFGGREFHLELQRTSKRGRGSYAIGTGTPPPGVDVQPLDDLVSDGGPLLFSTAD